MTTSPEGDALGDAIEQAGGTRPTPGQLRRLAKLGTIEEVKQFMPNLFEPPPPEPAPRRTIPKPRPQGVRTGSHDQDWDDVEREKQPKDPISKTTRSMLDYLESGAGDYFGPPRK